MKRATDFMLLSEIVKDRRGVVGVIGAAGMMLLTGATMLATDLTRLSIARERVQSAADAAMLAAARELDLTEDQAETAARAVFDANMPDDYLGLSVSAFDLRFESRHNALSYSDTVRLSVSADLPLFVASMADLIDPAMDSIMDINIESAAVKQTVGAELVMVLDNTGSMNGTKINDLREAAGILTDTVFQGRETVPNLVVGMVNYSATVNIGAQHRHWLTPAGQAVVDGGGYAPTAWRGCVMARADALDETDTAVDDTDLDTMLTPFLWPSSHWDWDADEIAMGADVSLDTDDCVALMDGDDSGDFEDVGGGDRSCNIWPDASNQVDELQASRNLGYGPNLGCPDAMTPLTPSYSTIDAAIDRIDAWHRGGTFSNLGLAWGWRMLSPAWQGAWRRNDADETPIIGLPYAYSKPFNHKIIVLMTDGDNQHWRHDFTSYGVDGANLPAGGIDGSMARLCTAIKNAGIVIYTVTFGSTNASIEDDFRACASDPATETRLAGPFYFDAPSGADLTGAFRNIGGQIQDLRLIQ